MKMLIGKVIGKRSFTGKNNNVYKQVCVSYEDKNAVGQMAQIIFVNKDYNVGDKINLAWDNFKLVELET